MSQLEMFARGPSTPARTTTTDCTPVAVFSPCGAYRYQLASCWDPTKDPLVWVMLNPSKAGQTRPDGTVETDMTYAKCCGFAERWGFGGVVLVNLYAYIETQSHILDALAAAQIDLVGPDNDAHLDVALAGARGLVAVAWGGHPLVAERAPAVLARVPAGVDVVCLGYTQDGHPRHPSRLGYDTPREPFAPATWPTVGITGPGKWGSTDGLVWTRVEGTLRVEPEGFTSGYLVRTAADARRVMRETAQSVLVGRR